MARHDEKISAGRLKMLSRGDTGEQTDWQRSTRYWGAKSHHVELYTRGWWNLTNWVADKTQQCMLTATGVGRHLVLLIMIGSGSRTVFRWRLFFQFVLKLICEKFRNWFGIFTVGAFIFISFCRHWQYSVVSFFWHLLVTVQMFLHYQNSPRVLQTCSYMFCSLYRVIQKKLHKV